MSQITYKCEGINSTGNGIITANNRKHLVPNLLPNEEAEIELTENGYGKVIKIVSSSSQRVKPKCPRYTECGGCHLQHCDYQMQLDIKTKIVKDCMQNFKLDSETVLPCIGMKEPFHYRNKIQMVISEKGRKIMAGFYEENTHKIINVDDCSIQDETANAIIRSCKELMTKHKIKPFIEDKSTGLIRHIMIKRSEITKQILVILVTVTETFPGRNNFVTDLRKAHPEITSIVQNINDRKTSVVLGEYERIIYGKGTIEDEIFDKKFIISAKTFYQVNAKQTKILYQKAIELAKPNPSDIVVDAFAGVGTIGIILADSVKQVYAVEINKASVKNAILNARINQIKNIRFYEDDATHFINQIADEGIIPDILFLDPPRAGVDQEMINAIERIKPKKIVYISCDPHTLARDLQKLVSIRYTLKRVQPVDMFCQTYHVETVSLLSLK
ncbi:MAG: 23S rRNA (uracil(1939)-C(5))-methyltransferase RlmD [Candidatus Izemoplasmatales bacterium]|nr:23S rRNA (uracil(1939)-C(5))-methyltransferase RlmD [Candidatus Izemoplasmatales bacterium]